MDATTDDARQGDDSGNEDPRLDNEPTHVSDTRRDSLCSVALSSPAKCTKADEVRKSSISELVGKSKKAAASLWTLLHAKVR